MYGRRNVALATLGGIASYGIYKKAESDAKSASTHSLVSSRLLPMLRRMIQWFPKWANFGGQKTASSNPDPTK